MRHVDIPTVGKNLFAKLVARTSERSVALLECVRRTRFPLKADVVNQIGCRKLPATVVAALDGLTFDLRLEDDVQKSIYFRAYEPQDLRLCRGLVPRGGTCLDVGANVGFFALHFAKWVGPTGSVHAFEPDPANFGSLMRNTALSRLDGVLHARQTAVSSGGGRVVLNRSGPAHSGWGSVHRFDDVAVGSTVVDAVTLDGYLASNGIGNVDLVKIDVEAHEPEVLDGARESIRGGVFRHMLVEWNGPRMRQRGHDLARLVGRLSAGGYGPSSPPTRRFLEAVRLRRRSQWFPCLNLLFSAADARVRAPALGVPCRGSV